MSLEGSGGGVRV